MTKITDNASLKVWVNSLNKPKKAIFIDIAEVTNRKPKTVERWHHNVTKLTAGNAALIQAAIERGEI